MDKAAGEYSFESHGGGNDDFKMPDIDPPELVAEKIIRAIENGDAEVFAHKWMEKK